jgi:N-acetylmuramoyl-L-alanine amidase
MRLRLLPAGLLAVLLLVGGTAAGAGAGGAPRPRIVSKPIPFGPERRAETAAYARRHYGIDTWRLRGPKVIVEHYTASNSFASAFSTFASNARDGELHELPGVCAHFVIDRDGTIYQLVPLGTMCRHTVGLNYTAIGIEHVGTSDAQVLGNARQIGASLRLTAWLMTRYGISLGNVIGHNESLISPYHHELYRAWRCQTHGDWTHADMKVYRARLKKVAQRYDVPLGPPPRWVDSGC